jgi:anaerobic selenocysteine-containing dehydrogenase
VDDKCKPNKTHFITNGKLCKNFAYLLAEKRLEEASFENQAIDKQKALDMLVQKLQNAEPSKVLYYKGSGNIGVMQGLPKHFFSQYGATFTKGSLCDGAGGDGLEQGRGHNVNPPIEKLIDAEVVVVWGRNLTVTSAHMYDKIKDKTFITIDPICTPIAKKSEVHLQINPKTDHELALLMARFAYMDDMEDEESYSQYASGADWFFDLAKSRPLVSYETTTGVELKEVSKALELMKNKKVAFLVGLGVQKYYEGAQIMRTIDSLAAYLGLHNKQAGGLWYLGDSSYGTQKPYETKANNKVDICNVDFASFDLVFIQGGNPVVSSPNSQNVIDGLEKTFVVYFGTTLNDTASYANLILPSSNFLSKKDVRFSYGHEGKAISYDVKQKHSQTLSEYDLCHYLTQTFDLKPLQKEEEIFNYYKEVKRESKEIETFEFIEELEVESLYEIKQPEQFYYLTAKQPKSLNSQFKIDNRAFMHPNSGFKQADEVIISSQYGKASFEVCISEDIKENCVMVYAGAKKGNFVTPTQSDENTFSAIYHEVVVNIDLS